MKISWNQWPADAESLPDHVQEYIDWLIDPSNAPHSKAAWAKEHGFHRQTVYNWHKDKRFQRQLESRAGEFNVDTERIQRVINAVFRAAEGGDMKAAQLYLQHVDKLNPKRVVIEDQRISSLSDDELKAELAAHGLDG